MKSFYTRLGFNVIKYFATSINFEVARKLFYCDSGKFRVFQEQKNGLQCYITIPQSVIFLHDNKIELNENRDMLRDLNDVPP